MTDRVSTQVVEIKDRPGQFALRYGVYGSDGALLRHEYIALDDLPAVIGSLLNKAFFLADPTAALYGLTGDAATVNNALYNVFQKTSNVDTSLGNRITSVSTDLSNKISIVSTDLSNIIFPSQVATANWSEPRGANTTVVKTIPHSIGTIPRRVRLIFNNPTSTSTAIIEVDYKNGNYEFLMHGTINQYGEMYGVWKRSLISNNYIFGISTSAGTAHYGSASITPNGYTTAQIRDITFTTTGINVTIANSSTSNINLISTVIAEVYK